MKSLILLFLLLSPQGVWALDCKPSLVNCNFYLCYEAEKHCGFEGYPLNFGYHYCDKFIRRPNLYFSQKGKDWIRNTRQCLQQKMMQTSSLTCSELWDVSIEHHGDCYTDNGYCELPLTDKWLISSIIHRQYIDIGYYLRSIKAINQHCLSKALPIVGSLLK